MKRLIGLLVLSVILVACSDGDEFIKVNDDLIEHVGIPYDAIWVELDQIEQEVEAGHVTSEMFESRVEDLYEESKKIVAYAEAYEQPKDKDAQQLLKHIQENAQVKQQYIEAVQNYLQWLNTVPEDEEETIVTETWEYEDRIESSRQALIDSDETVQTFIDSVIGQ